jgi:hypothetical protein
MVLDGQQRVQSLLLALGGDGWGFKLLDLQWHEHLSGKRPRGPRGKPHWSLGCLCIDVPALCQAYARTRRATVIDYTGVLQWVVADEVTGQSKLDKPSTSFEPLPKASVNQGRFVRLARLWEAAPDQVSIETYEAEERAGKILEEDGVSEQVRKDQERPLGALLMAFREVKQTRVTYLEFAQYEKRSGHAMYTTTPLSTFSRA